MGPGPDKALADEDWVELRSQLPGDEIDRAGLDDWLMGLAEPLGRRLARIGSLPDEWVPLGVDVRTVSMSGHGSCSVAGDSRIIYVNRKDELPLQRFTVAHELAHLLLGGRLAAEGGAAGVWQEERLCDRFASAILIPAEELSAGLEACGVPPGPDDILRFCGQFRVNVRPVVFAVGERLKDSTTFLLLARFRGHWQRPAELAFRVEATAGARHAFFPHGQRLVSLGLDHLVAAAERASHKDLFAGVDPNAVLGLRGLSGKRSSDTVSGPIAWRACRLGHDTPYVVAVLDLSELEGLGSR